MGGSLREAQALLQAHEEHSDIRRAQQVQVASMVAEATRLLEQEGCPSAETVELLRDSVLQHLELLESNAATRHEALLVSERMHLLQRDAAEADDWITVALEVAMDEDFKVDLRNIHGASGAHTIFQSELLAQRNMVDDLQQKSTALATTLHASEADAVVTALRSRWDLLESAAARKHLLLGQALELALYQAQVSYATLSFGRLSLKTLFACVGL